MTKSISIGTAQFGIDYGITNKLGKVPEVLVKKILKKASMLGIKYLDTAQDYGDSEKVIGKCMPSNSKLKIISKLSSLEKFQNKDNIIENLEKNFQKTLKNLGCKSINSFLIHQIKDLKENNSLIVWDWLESLKERNLIENIGVSIYEEKDLDNIPLKKINLIQVPISIYNQKFIESGYIKKLSLSGTLVHARSCFLQGLLLTKNTFWPNYISKELRIHHMKTECIAKNLNISMLDLNIAFIKQLSFLDSAIIGVTNLNELNQFINSWDKKNINIDKKIFKSLAWENLKDIDPRYWRKK